MHPNLYRYATHLDCVGGTQVGKTAGLEYAQRKRIMRYCSLMFDQKHYDRLSEHLVYIDPPCRVIRINLSNPTEVIPCNWISNLQGEELGAHAERITNTIAGVFGAKNLDMLQNYATTMTALIRWCAETGSPIQFAADLLEIENKELRLKAYQMAKDPETKRGIRQLIGRREQEWTYWTGSAQNRLKHFLNSQPLRQFTGTEAAINIADEVRKGSVILVNLAPSDQLSWDAAAMFAGLILSEFTRVSGKYYLDLDEAWAYLTYDAVKMLDTMAKKGLRLSLLHHDMEQFEDERVKSSIRRNCGIKQIFGGLTHEERRALVADLVPQRLHARNIKDILYRLETEYEENYYQTETDTSSDERSSFSTMSGTRFEPKQKQVKSSVTEYSLEEKLSMLAEELVLPNREYWLKTPDGARRERVPFLRRFLLPSTYRLEFMDKHAYGIPVGQAEASYLKRHQSFTGESDVPIIRTSRKKKTLSPL